MLSIFPQGGENKCHHSQVMSAFIKCVRLRRTDDAVYWFSHFCKFFPENGGQFRLSRRILILAGEDCIDIPVQWAISDWFGYAINFKDPRVWYRSAVAQIHLLCATKNWWSTPEGADYVLRWNEAEATVKNNLTIITTPSHPVAVFNEHAIVIKGYDTPEKRGDYAHRIAERARNAKRLDARLTAAIHVRHAKSLAKDDNFLGQALYRLTVGPLGTTFYPKLNGAAIQASVHAALERLKNPEKTPKWTQDGIHCYGSDPRFAGTIKNMMGCCCAFAKYGRLDPDDLHPEEFFDIKKARQLIAGTVKTQAAAGA